jgi:EAL domain-containing protein (putative c-di-GMP-specific phosphodiesterase class I)
VNLSPPEFEDDKFIAFLLEAASRRATMIPGSIKLEITETQVMKNIEPTIAKMGKLGDRGLEVMIDDFGSGYSSLAWLKRLPATVIKIDRGFVEHVVEDASDRKFLEGMVGMIRTRGKSILVEGVDTERKFEILRDLGCDLMQGYWLAKPLSAADFELLLDRSLPLPA